MAAQYRLLKDHWIGGVYYSAGDLYTVSDWIPTADVDPLNTEAVVAFYNQGPALPGVMNSQWSSRRVPAPVTYWYTVAPNSYALAGLGSDQATYPPRQAFIGRVE